MEKAFRLSGIYKYLPSNYSEQNVSEPTSSEPIQDNSILNDLSRINSDALLYTDQYSDDASDDDFSIDSMLPTPTINSNNSSLIVSATADFDSLIQQPPTPFFLGSSNITNQFQEFNISQQIVNPLTNTISDEYIPNLNSQFSNQILSSQQSIDNVYSYMPEFQNNQNGNSHLSDNFIQYDDIISLNDNNSNSINSLSEVNNCCSPPISEVSNVSLVADSNMIIPIPELQHTSETYPSPDKFSNPEDASNEIKILSNNDVQIIIQNWMEVKCCSFKDIIAYIYSDIIQSLFDSNSNIQSSKVSQYNSHYSFILCCLYVLFLRINDVKIGQIAKTFGYQIISKKII